MTRPGPRFDATTRDLKKTIAAFEKRSDGLMSVSRTRTCIYVLTVPMCTSRRRSLLWKCGCLGLQLHDADLCLRANIIMQDLENTIATLEVGSCAATYSGAGSFTCSLHPQSAYQLLAVPSVSITRPMALNAYLRTRSLPLMSTDSWGQRKM